MHVSSDGQDGPRGRAVVYSGSARCGWHSVGGLQGIAVRLTDGGARRMGAICFVDVIQQWTRK